MQQTHRLLCPRSALLQCLLLMPAANEIGAKDPGALTQCNLLAARLSCRLLRQRLRLSSNYVASQGKPKKCNHAAHAKMPRPRTGDGEGVGVGTEAVACARVWLPGCQCDLLLVGAHYQSLPDPLPAPLPCLTPCSPPHACHMLCALLLCTLDQCLSSVLPSSASVSTS